MCLYLKEVYVIWQNIVSWDWEFNSLFESKKDQITIASEDVDIQRWKEAQEWRTFR